MTISPAVHKFLSSTTVKTLAWRAFQCGNLRAIQYRISSKSPTGVTFAAHFTRHDSAAKYARRISTTFQIPVKITRSPLGHQVSVPAPRPHTRLPEMTNWMIHVTGGIMGLYETLFNTGLGQISPRSITQKGDFASV
jgi:hypothetical protein